MTVNVFAKQLIASRAQAVALIASIDALLAHLEEEARKEEAAAAPESPPEEESECLHPPQHREPCPTMGHPNQFYCRKCMTQQEG